MIKCRNYDKFCNYISNRYILSQAVELDKTSKWTIFAPKTLAFALLARIANYFIALMFSVEHCFEFLNFYVKFLIKFRKSFNI